MDNINIKWITDGITPDAVEWAENFGKYLASDNGVKPLTTNQLRKFFGEIKRIEAEGKCNISELIMLKPLLAYSVGRDKGKTKIRDFAKQITVGVETVIKAESDDKRKSYFNNFVKIFEAIVAYHRYFGGE